MSEEHAIHVRNVVSARTHEGFVTLHYDEQPLGQFTPDEARGLAGQIHECAAIAETEALLFGFLVQRIELTDELAAEVLRAFRDRRNQEEDSHDDHSKAPT